MNTVSWLAQQENLISIRPREPGRAAPHAGQPARSTVHVAFSVLLVPVAVFGARLLRLVAEAIAMGGSSPRSPWSLVLAGWSATSTTSRSQEPAPPADSASEKPFASVKADDIEELRITAGGETTRLKKPGTTWSIVEPVRADADAGEVSSITGSLASLEIERVVDEKPADLKAFGLEPARIDVRFKVKGQAAEQRDPAGRQDADRRATSTPSCPTRRACSWWQSHLEPRSTRPLSRCATRRC